MQDMDLMKYVDNFGKTQHIRSQLIFGDPALCPNPFISIVIPTYKRPELLKLAIDSALNQLNPACTYEVIVVDNEYTSEESSATKDLLMKYKDTNLLYYQNTQNLGAGGNWNRCIELARAKWVAFLHDDDLLVEDYVNRILRLLSKRKDVSGISTSFRFIDDRSQNDLRGKKIKSFIKRIYSIICWNKLMRLHQTDSIINLANVYGAPTCGSIYRKDHLLESGGFNDAYFPSFDWFFSYQYCKKHKLYKALEGLGYYRISVNSSLLDSVKKGLLKDRLMFMLYVSNNTKMGKLMNHVFENEQYLSIFYSKTKDYPGKAACDYFDPLKIKKRPLRGPMYKAIRSIYWNVKTIVYLLIG